MRHGRVLAARRGGTGPSAGRWEFPGGKVEPGEPPEAALVRELHEELVVRARVTSWLEGEAQVGERYRLRVALCETTDAPTPTEHDRLRWLGPDELDDVDWLAPDRPFLPELRQILRRPPTVRPNPE